MGIGSFIAHLGIVPGLIVGAEEGDVGKGFKEGLEGTMDGLEMTAGIMTGDPMMVVKGASNYVQQSMSNDDPSTTQLLNQAAQSAFEIA